MSEWVCASCGARHDANDPPCRQCGGEQFAKIPEEQQRTDTISRTAVHWVCDECGKEHYRNNPPCSRCGSMSFSSAEPGESDGEDAPGPSRGDTVGIADSDFEQGFMASVGDAVFNKSFTRQLIDIELLLISGFTWTGFLFSEALYHHWQLSKNRFSQYAYPDGQGEGPITKIAKGLFYLQVAVVALVVVATLILVAFSP